MLTAVALRIKVPVQSFETLSNLESLGTDGGRKQCIRC